MTTSEAAKTAGDWRGADLGTRTVSYTERDAILYALAVGAKATELDLVFEDQLRVLPTFALTLAQWAPDALGSAERLRHLDGTARLARAESACSASA